MERHESDGLSRNYCEYIVEAKCEGELLTAKLLVILIIALLAVIPSVFILRYAPMTEVVFLVLVGILYWFLSRFFHVEYEYIVAGAEITLDKIYGRRTRKTLVKIPFSSVVKIAPCSENNKREYEQIPVKKRIYAGKSKKDRELYFILYDDAAHEKSVLFINVTNKTLDTFRYYRSSLVETEPGYLS